MRRVRIAQALGSVSFLLAVGAMYFLALWPYAYEGSVYRGGTFETTSASIIEENGLGVMWVLAFPAVLSALGLMASFLTTLFSKIILWAAAVLLVFFSVATSFSVGIYYYPATLALLLAAVLHVRARPAS